MSREMVLGLALGMSTEPTGLVVVESTRSARGVLSCAVRYLKQYPLGTPYAEIAANVGDIVRQGGLGSVPLVVDITAVGPQVFPLLRAAVQPAWLVPLLITAGGVAAKDETQTWRVPKRDLVTTVQLLLQGERFKVAPVPEADLLLQELRTFRAHAPTASTNPDALDWRTQPGDALVFATALACWWSQHHRPYYPGAFQSETGSELWQMLERVFPTNPRP